MGLPFINIYTLTDSRNNSTIEAFLDKYTDRNAIEAQPGYKVDLIPKSKTSSEGQDNKYVWIPAETATRIIEIGLSDTSNCFTLYVDSKIPGIENVMLTFTQDGQLILGLSIAAYTDGTENEDNYVRAQELADSLQLEFDGKASYYEVESLPADNEAEFLEALQRISLNRKK